MKYAQGIRLISRRAVENKASYSTNDTRYGIVKSEEELRHYGGKEDVGGMHKTSNCYQITRTERFLYY